MFSISSFACTSQLAYPCHWDGKRQGRRALVIANEFFDAGSLMNRLGTKVDVFNLENLLKYLNFDFSVYRNLTAEVMKQNFSAFQNCNESCKSQKISYPLVTSMFSDQVSKLP